MRSASASRIAFGVVALALGCAPAYGYVRTVTKTTGVPLRWLVGDIALRPDRRGSQDLALPAIEDTLGAAVDNWNSRMADCTSMRLRQLPAVKIEDIGRDRSPIIVFRDRDWQRIGADEPNDPAAIAITTVYYTPTPGDFDGTISDADIELNGVYFTFTTDVSTATPRPGTSIADLENTLTHELGHVLGLAHTCWVDRENRPTDDQGNLAPRCNEASPEVAATTMFAYAPPGDIEKRSVEADDVRGVCDTYPLSLAPARSLTVEGGCQAMPGSPSRDVREELDALARGSDDRNALIAKLRALSAAAPEGDARDDASLWLADLLRYGGANAEAEQIYRAVLARAGSSVDAAAHARRAYAGLGDLAALAGDDARARDLYALAQSQASGATAAALDAKRALAARHVTLARADRVAALALLVALVFFAVTLLRRSAPVGAIPTGVWYAAPIFALLAGSTLPRSAALAGALASIGVGALALSTLAIWSFRARARERGWLYAAMVSAANLALIFLVLRRAGLWDATGSPL